MSAERYAWRQLCADRGSVFHLPVGDAWWWQSTEEQAVLDSGTLLHRVRDEVHLHREVVARDVLTGPARLQLRPPEPVSRANHRWSHPSGPLPFGAQRARRFWTSPCGTTKLWDDDFWLYRQHGDEPPEAIGRLGADDEVLIGPRGAVLVSQEGLTTAGASPDGPLLSLGIASHGDWWAPRWSEDGTVVSLAGPEGARVDLRTAATVAGPSWPANAAGSASLNDEQTQLSTPSGTVHLPTCSAARLDSLLAGPGGVSWDLSTGTKLFESPVWRLGATVAVSEQRFFTVDYESGAGEWRDPRTGEHLGAVQLPLERDELVDEGWAHDGAAIIGLSSGRVLAVRGETLAEVELDAPETPRRLRLRLPLEWDDAAQVGNHTWVWSESGLLLALPFSS